jgi:RNA polymerase sigma factor (sigma-70 family)
MATAQVSTLLRHIQKLAAGPDVQQQTDRQLLDDFACRRSEAAFAALVGRHGPMVLRVCRRVLGHEQDAEDAFQATFLVLARNTAAIHKRDALAAWLHGVAYRTARSVRRGRARRRSHEARLRAVMPPPAASPTWDDVQAVLDEEVQRLPPRYREAFVRCVLEGQGGPDVAAELGCPAGTIKSQVNRARRLLQQRLARRGIQLSALLAALSVAEAASRAALPAAQARAAVGFGLLAAAGEPAAAVIPPRVAALAAGVTRTMFLTTTKIAIAVLFATGLLAAGVSTFQALAAKAPQGAPAAEAEAPASDQPAARKGADEDPLTFSGRVLDPDGKPIAGAKLYVLYESLWPVAAPAASDAEGRFHFQIARADFVRSENPAPWENAKVVAVARGYGLGLAKLRSRGFHPAKFRVGQPPPRTDLAVQLARDDAPLNGRVLDLQGKPVAGVTIRVHDVHAPFDDDLAAFVRALKDKKELYPPLKEHTIGFNGGVTGRDVGTLFAPVSTGADGRFIIKGVGRERLVRLRIEGPAIVTRDLYAMTRPGETIQAPGYRRYPNTDLLTLHGNGFDFVAAPCKPIVGVVRDKDSGKPIPGAVVTSYRRAGSHISAVTDLRAVADREGRYRLVGMPKGDGNVLRAGPPQGEPYLMAVKEVADTPGFEPVTADFALKRGVWITGRVLDKATGAPLPAQVEYVVFEDNPHRKEVPDLSVDHYLATNAADGTFRTVGLPGRGLLAARAWGYRHRLAVGADKIKGLEPNGLFRTYPHVLFAQGYHVLVELNPAADAKEVTCDMLVDPGRTLKGRVLGPDGKPLTGVRVCGMRSYNAHGHWEAEPLRTAEFVVTGLERGQARLLQLVHAEKKLAGSLVVKGEDDGPVTVRLVAAGTVTGRLVTPDGEPVTGGQLTALRSPIGQPDLAREDPTVGSLRTDIIPDKKGKFRIEGMIPGLSYFLGYVKGMYLHRLGGAAGDKVTIKPGEDKDLGDVVVKPIQ